MIDPDKISVNKVSDFIDKINHSIATHIFVGGSIVDDNQTDALIKAIKSFTKLPIVLFPGDITQISNKADALLFLSLISGRNPEYLIGKHVDSVSKLKRTNLEVIPTGYILVENGKQTSVEIVTHTKPISRDNIEHIVNTAKAGELLGMKLIYLEAGSGANQHVSLEMISYISQNIKIPLIVGGGIRSMNTIQEIYDAGADLVVIGTAFENNPNFFEL